MIANRTESSEMVDPVSLGWLRSKMNARASSMLDGAVLELRGS